MSYQSSKARQSFEFEIDSMISVIEDTFKNTTVTHGTKNHVLKFILKIYLSHGFIN